MTGTPLLTLYFRDGCHLCEEMWQQLQELRAERHFELVMVDVDSDPQLQRQYGALIPVLTGAGETLCHYYLDPQALFAFLDQAEGGDAV